MNEYQLLSQILFGCCNKLHMECNVITQLKIKIRKPPNVSITKGGFTQFEKCFDYSLTFSAFGKEAKSIETYKA